MYSLKNLSVRQFRSIKSLIGINYSRKQYVYSAKETSTESQRTTHFGFKTVHENEKADKGLQTKN